MGKGKRKRLNKTAKEKAAWQSSTVKKNISETINRNHLLGVRLDFIICVLLALITFTIYSNTFYSPFVFDDQSSIVYNHYIRLTSLDLQRLYEAGFKSPCLRPVANISFALNYYFGGYNVFGYHLVNVIIHLISGIFVYFVALATFRLIHPSLKQPLDHSPTEQIYLMSFFSALIFVAHPLQTQSVTYIVQRMNSMSVMFFLLSLFFYIHGRLSQIRWRRWTLFFGCVASWVMALGSKEIAGTLPFIVLLYEWYFFQNLSTAWLRKNVGFLFILITIVCVLTFIYLGTNPVEKILATYEHRDFTLWERVLTQFRVVILYISLLIYPHPSRLNLLHHFTTSHSLVNPITTLLSLLTILGLVGLALGLARRNRLISFGILWFFINLALESSVIGLEMIFEHRLYLPMLGPALIIPYLLFQFPLKRRSWAVVVSSLIILSLGTATYLRNKVWENKVTLLSDCVKKSPQEARPHVNLGAALSQQNKFTEAIKHFSEALRINPGCAEAHSSMGLVLSKQGKITEAIRHFSEAVRINPDYVDGHTYLGLVLSQQGKITEAARHFSEVLRIIPGNSEAHKNMGIVLAQQGKITEAIKHFSEAVQINPGNAEAHKNMGILLSRQGKITEAIIHLSEALRINPGYAEAHKNMGIVLAQQGKITEAIRHFSEALRINPGNSEVHNNMGIALAQQGKITEAIRHFSEALRINPGNTAARRNLKKMVWLSDESNVEEHNRHESSPSWIWN